MKKDILTNLFKKMLDIIHLKLSKEKEKILLQIFKFVIVGGIAFTIDYLVLILCKELLNINVLISAAIAFIISVIFNYILSIKWVFEVNEKNSEKRNFIIFIIFSIMGLILTEIIMWIGVNIFNFNYLVVKIIATIIVMIFNFVTRKKFLE